MAIFLEPFPPAANHPIRPAAGNAVSQSLNPLVRLLEVLFQLSVPRGVHGGQVARGFDRVLRECASEATGEGGDR